jgi:hypothetical protein
VNRQENDAYVRKFFAEKLDRSDDFEEEDVGGRTVTKEILNSRA